ncbi:MAG: L,D-transpeptidase [Candidatus Kapabacteria bacterium]|nr:L,D-transpeptidase [Candidatus Kapabacteria bacterium]
MSVNESPEPKLINCDTFPSIHYSKIRINSQKHLNQIFSDFKKNNELKKDKFDYLKILRTLNRKELRFFRVGDSIVIPDKYYPNILAYSLLPHCYQGAIHLKKIIIVSNKLQCYGCYEKGRLIRFAAVNSGKERTQTYPGRYALNWRERVHRSSIDSSWVMPFTWNFHAEAGNAFHQFEMPGRPVSHSCCRQFLDDAEWLWHWGEGTKRDSNKKFIPMSGTPVIIIDHFDFNRKRGGPWLEIKSNKDTSIVLPNTPMMVEEALIPYCQIPLESRGSLRNRKRFVHAEDTLRAHGIIREGVKLIETKNFNKLRQEKLRKEEKEKLKKEKIDH